MRSLSLLGTLWRNLTQKERMERDLAEEVRSYLELSADAKMRDGLDEGTARRAAAVSTSGRHRQSLEDRAARPPVVIPFF